MDPVTIGWGCIVLLLILLALGVPVAFALAASGFVGYWVLGGGTGALSVMGVVPYGNLAKYAFTVIPLFLLMGNIAYHAGFGSDIFRAARYSVGRIHGGLAQATVTGCAAFGAACGSGLATCAMMTKLAIPEMLRYGYNRKIAIGSVAAAGTIAQMIPPSILMVLYGIITEQSIGKMLIAGIIPGLIAAANYMIMIYVRARLNPALAAPLKGVSLWETFFNIKDAWTVALLAFIVMGGIYTGFFTPTEAGGTAAFSAMALALAMKRLKLRGFYDAILDTVRINSMILLIMAGAYIFGTLLAISQVPTVISTFLTESGAPRFVILLGILFMYIVLGTFLDMVAAMFLTLPIVFPSIVILGYDPIWFGVIMVHMCEIALITPPYGLNLFVIKGAVEGASTNEIIRGIVPFLLMDLITLAIYVLFPEVALFLPSKMG
jgi:tripartite ATP-independent transporter DctM subunit